MHQNYITGQTTLSLNLDFSIPANRIASVISEFVDSIPNEVILETTSNTGRPAYHPAMMLKILLFAYSRRVWYEPRNSDKNFEVFIMSKLSKQDKIDIYNNWKRYHKSLSQLGREYGVRPDNLYYLIRLIDLHGLEILNKSYSSYSVEFKKTAIKRILINDEPANQVSLDLGLPSSGMIYN